MADEPFMEYASGKRKRVGEEKTRLFFESENEIFFPRKWRELGDEEQKKWIKAHFKPKRRITTLIVDAEVYASQNNVGDSTPSYIVCENGQKLRVGR